jgi:phosphoribosylcarboxyaminoimidazole (NCAIR) mutase
MPFPIIGNIAIAKPFRRKIIAMLINKSFGFAFMIGEIAAMAVAPHIAVPEAIRIDNLESILKIFEINMPETKTKITKIEMYGKYVEVM